MVSIYHNDIKVNEMQIDAAKGYNEANFDLTFSKKGLKSFSKMYENKNIITAQNGKNYLPKGTYIVKIGSESTNFSVK